MFAYLFWIPVGACVVLGTIAVLDPDLSPRFRAGVLVTFASGVWLQFLSRWHLAGLMLLVALALVLAIWMRWQRAALG